MWNGLQKIINCTQRSSHSIVRDHVNTKAITRRHNKNDVIEVIAIRSNNKIVSVAFCTFSVLHNMKWFWFLYLFIFSLFSLFLSFVFCLFFIFLYSSFEIIAYLLRWNVIHSMYYYTLHSATSVNRFLSFRFHIKRKKKMRKIFPFYWFHTDERMKCSIHERNKVFSSVFFVFALDSSK